MPAQTLLNELKQAAMQPLETAHSLPFAAYTDNAVLAAEAQHIFHREWVFVCMAGELPDAGDYYALTLAGEPIIVMRGEDGHLCTLANICRHRGTVLLDAGFGRVDKYIVCPYHAWAYAKDGSLQAIPFNEQIHVDRTGHTLSRFQCAEWNGMVFVNLDPQAAPLSTRLQGIDPYLAMFEPQTFSHCSGGTAETWLTNWKLAMENAMESYHLFKVHENTLETYSPTRQAYYIAGSSEWTLTGGATARKKGLLEKVFGASYSELYEHYILVSLPPSFVGVLTYGSFGWLSAHPVDAGTTLIRSGATFTKDGSGGSPQSDEFTRAFFAEDQQMCERVQTGMSATLSRGGKLVDMERVVVDFHQFLATRLSRQPATPLFEDSMAQRFLAGA